MMRFFVCGITNVVIQMYMVQYIRCFFRLRNNERCYTGVWANILNAEIIGLWNDERYYTDRCG